MIRFPQKYGALPRRRYGELRVHELHSPMKAVGACLKSSSRGNEALTCFRFPLSRFPLLF